MLSRGAGQRTVAGIWAVAEVAVCRGITPFEIDAAQEPERKCRVQRTAIPFLSFVLGAAIGAAGAAFSVLKSGRRDSAPPPTPMVTEFSVSKPEDGFALGGRLGIALPREAPIVGQAVDRLAASNKKSKLVGQYADVLKSEMSTATNIRLWPTQLIIEWDGANSSGSDHGASMVVDLTTWKIKYATFTRED